MSHEDTLASTTVYRFGSSVRFNARQHFYILRSVEIVANVVSESSLFVCPIEFPLGTVGVAGFQGTLAPCFVHLLCALALLCNDEAGVHKPVSAGVVVLRLVPLDGHRDEGFRRDIPVVEKPF